MPSLRRAAALFSGLTLIAGLTAFTAAPAAAVPGADSTVFINEIHYDNDGADSGEAVEIAGPAGTDLSGWTLVLYNGSNGTEYGTATLSGTIPSQSGGYGTVNTEMVGIQNGAPDGVALVNGTSVVQFLSYEGAFAATNGPANGQLSTDIGVAEAASTPVGQSLQLTGSGSAYGDFTWTGPTPGSPGQPNAGQTFGGGGGPAQPVADCGDATFAVDTDENGSRDVSATDPDSRVVTAKITSADVAGITLDGFTASGADGQAATATLNVADTTADGSYEVEIEFATDDEPAQTATCTVTVVVSDQDAVTLLSTIQGDGAASPLVGDLVNVEAVATSVITDTDVTDGFFLQEEDADADADPTTSEGIYVFCGSNCPGDLAAGDRFRVSGEVREFFSMTQINATGGGSVELLESGAALPTAAVVELPGGRLDRGPRHLRAHRGHADNDLDHAGGERVLQPGSVRRDHPDRRGAGLPVHADRRAQCRGLQRPSR